MHQSTPSRLGWRSMGGALLTLVLSVVGCGRAADDGRLTIVATTGPVGDAVMRVVGDRAEVRVMMGPGVDPHLYREQPSDLVALDAADVVVYSGLHLEGRLGEVFDGLARRKTVIAITAGLEEADDPRLLSPPDFAGYHDPHVWHDAAMWADCIGYLAERMAEHDPQGAEAYRANAADYRAELLELDGECRERIATIPAAQRRLVTAHDAFAYFSRAYGLESVGLKGVSTEDEIDLGRMAEVVDLIVENQVPCVFVESAVAPRVVESLIEPCRQRGHEVRIGGELFADALGPEDSGADTYVGMLRANVATIVAGLGAGSEGNGAGPSTGAEPSESEELATP
ncbi:metal ABC transporter solute-binding protein, Zn/Mn family [Pseudobythopirellula maris]|nr:zinc ABC transporter substrate-binding protein [Pseudobythopirellula maris]